ncbi:MAG: type II toxin-antitoxin system HicB family antitoxin [Gammaproteobacteria bacterium]|nr:type II toxin-antitoxin system HicB family antitoxin [Gammaproteobacteria bacterium]MBU1654615.1 type II toxin-antitoxin system HicB family antitoxin [Gammaproteobacteria bacterium]MBU1959945.1 type II toxin-antitoxin system HicB family antitoxin [Gammaproteobacteria bacterium]
MKNTLEYKGYRAGIEFDPEDHILFGHLLDIDDIVSFHGESVADFERSFHESVDDYIAACEQLGQLPDKPASGRLMLRIAPEIHAAALKSATAAGQSLNKWAEAVLRRATHTDTSLG